MRSHRKFQFYATMTVPMRAGGSVVWLTLDDLCIGGEYFYNPKDEAACDKEYLDIDIDEVSYRGTNVLNVLKWLGDGSVSEIDKVYEAAAAHCMADVCHDRGHLTGHPSIMSHGQ